MPADFEKKARAGLRRNGPKIPKRPQKRIETGKTDYPPRVGKGKPNRVILKKIIGKFGEGREIRGSFFSFMI